MRRNNRPAHGGDGAPEQPSMYGIGARLLVFLLSVCAVMLLVLAAAKSAPNATPVEAADGPLAVGVVFVSGVDDGGWSQAHYNGFESLGDMDLRLLYRENVSDKDDSVVAVVDELAEEGAKVIFTTSVDYGPYMLQCAGAHPDIMFYHCTGTETAPNLATYIGRMYQARFLTGIVAGMETRTNELGYVAAMPIPEVLRGINAFTLGVRSVNPEAVVHVEWTGAWEDAALEEQAVNRLLRHPIDVLAQHQNTATPTAALQKAGRDDVLSIGYNLDRSGDFPDSYLTAAVWNWGAFYRSRLQEYLMGQFVSRSYWDGIETGIVDLCRTKHMDSPELLERLEEARRRMLGGEWDVFYGPIYDRDGRLRVAQGETLSDEYLLQNLYWFVDGVEATPF